MEASPWWQGHRRERYWVVVQYRYDDEQIGDPITTKRDSAGHTPWHHRLVTAARVNDVVFHYEPWQQLITHRSRVESRARDSRLAGRPAWRLPIADVQPLVRPVSLAALRVRNEDVTDVLTELRRVHSDRLYGPFVYRDQQLSFNQIYFAKLPAAVVGLFPDLRRTAEHESAGRPYRPAGQQPANRSAATVFTTDPAKLERAVASHQRLQDQIAKRAGAAGWAAHSPRPIDPDYDLLLARAGAAIVVEVKSLTKANEDRQMRLGLGQVLMYRHVLAAARPPGVRRVRAAIAAERRPSSDAWLELCERIGVVLVWPTTIARIWEE
jgi:hypothetical protein